MLGDLKNPRWMYLKGGLFVVMGLLAGGLLLAETRTLTSAALLVLCVWSWMRAYYFAFYVIEHYIDPGYKCAGLGSFLRYLWTHPREANRSSGGSPGERGDVSPPGD
jgi:hypothetical protein